MEKIIDENIQGQALSLDKKEGNTRKLFIESYGCQMNFSDSEIVASILAKEGFNTTQKLEDADLVLVNTCSIREKAELTVRKRLEKYNAVKRINPKMKVGVLGCMAERLKSKFLEEEKIVDLVVGPDAYKDLPNLIEEVDAGRNAVNVVLSKEETYGDISPVRLQSNGVSAFVSITRGCDNMCTFCVVPFTRGRERSRDPQSIIQEIDDLVRNNFKEITLLGQNVDSYLWYGGGLKKDFDKASDLQKATAIDFAKLLDLVADKYPKLRIRFSTSNPQDMIIGFPTETEEDHQDTLSLLERIKYEHGYMYAYSERPGTLAERKLEDDVPEEVKKRRLAEVIALQRTHCAYRHESYIGQTFEVLIEKESKKSDQHWSGRTTKNIVAIFPKGNYKIGDFVMVRIDECTSATLLGEAVGYSDNN